ncbi:hypothetical protein [Polyangium sp. 6x1]|uniref:hypothetical protein n=1 Tax=Polyangium sp. 6x1 TaxID=3042689 RepID=UPI0024831E0F|nr:hypothetical protein [Polyangium sp. 6x1]MDI1444138.1 hypothetical protein [Polyangium sp. 6x1]
MRAWKPLGVAALLTAASCVQVLGGDNPYHAEEPVGGGGQAGGAGGAGGASSSSTGGAGGTSEPCTPGEMRVCYSGPAGTEGFGDCKTGVQVCADDGSEFGPCEDEVVPAAEDCTLPGDEDCDGSAVSACTGTPKAAFTPPGSSVSPMTDVLSDVAVTPDGGYVVAGTVEFLESSGPGSVYVAKIGPDGAMQWEKKYPCEGFAVARGVAVSPAGDVTVVGEFDGMIHFGGSELQSIPSNDIFMATFDAMGAHIWSKSFGAANRQAAHDVDTDAAGNLYVTGWVTDENVSLGGDTVAPSGQDLFVASYDSAGTHRWSRIFVNQSIQRGRRLTVMENGDVAVVGETYSGADLGGGSLPGGGDYDLVVAMYKGETGAHVWSKVFGSSGNQLPGSIAAAPNGNVLVTGHFTGSLDFGGGTMSAVGGIDVYLAEFAGSNGNHVRSKRFGITQPSQGTGIAVDGAGNVVVTGYFNGSINFGSGTITTSDGNDSFVVKLAEFDWAPLWTRTFGGTGSQTAWAAAVDGKGDVIVGGSFEQQIVFGAPLVTVTSSGGADLFSVRLAP